MRLIVELDLQDRTVAEASDALDEVADRVGEWLAATDTHNGWHLLRDRAGDPIGRLQVDTLDPR
jgi:hypothetical protein